MTKKRIFYSELAYLIGLPLLAMSAALLEKADFGVSMVVAPAYLLHLKISQFLPFFSFGMAEYTLQAILLIAMILILRKFKISYLFSIVTAVLYAIVLDTMILLLSFVDIETLFARLLLYICGIIICSLSISLLFHSYITPEVYELFVKEVSLKTRTDINRFKQVYDCVSCAVSIILSFTFFGLWQFEGIKVGTIICAIVNGPTIGLCSKLLERHFEFKDGLKFRTFFEK